MATTSTHPTPLIRADELASLAGTPGVILADCRFELTNPQAGRLAYVAGHIPGAVFVDVEAELSAPRNAGSGRHPLPTPQDFARLLGRLGFTAASRVIACDQAGGAAASRLWWMLRARGHGNVQVLDGGYAAWLAAGGKHSTAPAAIVPTEVPAREFTGVFTAAQIAAALAADRIALVDARAADRFAGRNETIDPVAGHVPGALNHPYTLNLDEHAHWLAPEALRGRWQPVLDRAAGRALVAMCGSGITACHNLLALELAGHSGAQLYAGSWSEWITDPARPIATGEPNA